MTRLSLFQRLVAEAIGTAFLVFIGVGVGARHPDRQRQCAVHDGRPRHDLPGVRHGRRRHRLRPRAHRRQPHQPGGHARAGRRPASSRGARCRRYIGAQVVGAIVGAAAIIGVLGHEGQRRRARRRVLRRHQLDAGVHRRVRRHLHPGVHRSSGSSTARRRPASPASRSAWSSSPRSSRWRRPPARRSTRPAPSARCSSSSSPGGDVKWDQLPVYLVAELLAGVAAALLYGVLARTPADRAIAGWRHRPRPTRSRTPGQTVQRLTDPPTPTRRGSLMKKLINDPNDVVAEALLGIEAAHPDLQRRPPEQDHLPRRRAAARQGRASSPAAAPATSRCTAGSSGWACSTRPAPARCSPRRCPTRCSPPPSWSTAAPASCTSSRTTPATCMNFEMAAELAAAETGARVVSVVTDDDVAVQDSTWTAGRRGVGVDGAAGEDRRRRGRAGPHARRRSPTSPARSTPTAAAWAWR